MASNEIDSTEEVPRKKIKLSGDQELQSPDAVAEDLSAHTRINSLDGFKLKSILANNSVSKSIFAEGIFDATEEKAVILLDKNTFDKETIEKFLRSADLALNLKLNAKSGSNVVNYACYPKVEQGDIMATIICPATSKHVEKYKRQPLHIVNESPDAYKNVVLPHIESQNFSLQWVYNILEHKSEVERIVYEDTDKELGFILLPDLKWNDPKKDSLYLLAIVHMRNVKSLRDLTASHLPLLKNIMAKGCDTISQKFGIPHMKLRVYLHYQPSYYHLHVHFTTVNTNVPGCQFEKAHLLNTVINNIELSASYYQETTLTYLLKQNDPLFLKLKEAGYVDNINQSITDEDKEKAND